MPRAGSYFVSAAVQACDFLKEKIARIMAHDLALADASPADFEFRDGFVTYARDTNIKKTFREAVERIIMAPINMPKGESGGLEHTAFFEAEKPMIAFNADVCTVEVDIETGQFKILTWTTSEDVGQIINPQIVEGQMQGAIVQGLSNTMFEQFVYDENGQQLTADFENYKLATAADVPDIKVTHAPTPCPYTPLGSRGIGEGRPSDVPGTLCNAICDALSPFDIGDHGSCPSARIRSGARSRRRADPPEPSPLPCPAPCRGRWRGGACASAPARASLATAGSPRWSWSSRAASTTSPSSASPSAPSRRETLAVRRGQGSGYNPQLEDRMRAVLPPAAARGVRVLSNMGAADPLAAGRKTSRDCGRPRACRPALRGAAGRRCTGCRRRPAGPPVDGDRRAAREHPAPHGVGERLSRRGRRWLQRSPRGRRWW